MESPPPEPNVLNLVKPEESLLKYEPPVYETQEEVLTKDPLQSHKKPQLPPLESKSGALDDILNVLFPNLEIDEEGKHFLYKVSQEQASRYDLEDLEKRLQVKLMERQARKTGICPVREDLHNQLFDEIIRQCTINCPERGLLLVNVRDQIKMTLAAYQTLYHGSVIFGIRKQLQAEQGRADLETKIEELDKKKIYLENRKIELENELDSIEKSFKELKTIEDAKKQTEMVFLKNQTKHLESFLKSVKQSTN